MMKTIELPNSALSDFEKLVISRKYIEALKADLSKANIEIGILQSELEEAKYTATKAVHNAPAVKRDEYIISLLKGNTELRKQNAKLEKDNMTLIMKVLKLEKGN